MKCRQEPGNIIIFSSMQNTWSACKCECEICNSVRVGLVDTLRIAHPSHDTR